jgi:hypothetical protein
VSLFRRFPSLDVTNSLLGHSPLQLRSQDSFASCVLDALRRSLHLAGGKHGPLGSAPRALRVLPLHRVPHYGPPRIEIVSPGNHALTSQKVSGTFLPLGDPAKNEKLAVKSRGPSSLGGVGGACWSPGQDNLSYLATSPDTKQI